jgi:hypothetical protein
MTGNRNLRGAISPTIHDLQTQSSQYGAEHTTKAIGGMLAA